MAQVGRIAFIGAGNMATALIEGILAAKTAAPSDVVATDVRQEALDAVAERYGIRTELDNNRAVADAQVVMLCMKPQQLAQVVSALSPSLPQDALVVSIAAGVPCAVIEGLLPGNARVVRTMPNTPALVQAGATGIAAGTHATADDVALAETLFSAVGTTVAVEEALIDAVTGVSGSGPAYVFRFVEALVDGGVAVGLDREQATTLARQTLFGAAKLLAESGEEAAVLRARVTSKGGTTAAGLAALEAAGFPEAIAKCVKAAADRGRELGEETRRQSAAKP